MSRTPTILQMEATECGAVALAIVLSHHGRNVPLAELREACRVSRDGVKAAHIVKAARAYGLETRAWSCRTDQLRRFRGPLIAFWNFNHFLVVERIGAAKVWLNDPEMGHRTVTLAEFNDSYTGIALAFEKGPAFRKGGDPRRIGPAIRRYLRGHAGAILLVMLATLALVLPVIVAASLPKAFLDGVASGAAQIHRTPLLAAFIACAVTLALLTYVQQRVLSRAETRIATAASARFFQHVLRLPFAFLSQRQSGEIEFRLNTNDRIAFLALGEIATHAANSLMAVLCGGLMFWYDARLAATCLAIVSINFVALKLTARRREESSRRLAQERGRLSGFTAGSLLSIESVKAMGAEEDLLARWCAGHARTANAAQDLESGSQALAAVPPMLAGLTLAAVFSIGSLHIMDGVLTVGALIAFHSLLQGLLGPVNRLIGLGGRIEEMAGDVTRIEDVLQNPPDAFAAREFAGSIERLEGRIEFRNITFGHSRNQAPAIESFCLTIPAGSRVALVGGSGSGKSTLACLLCGLHQPWSGEILLDERPISSIPREVIANSLALVEQDVQLFEGTIAQNITLWDATLEPGAITRAARDAAIHDDILGLAGDYQFPLSEGGRNLSGGQRQRIEIARALCGDPRILVLDESTSALDAMTEKQVVDNLRRRGCTCLVVAHRLSSIRDCDEIVVLENGRIVERGSHDHLFRLGGVYARLLNEQSEQRNI